MAARSRGCFGKMRLQIERERRISFVAFKSDDCSSAPRIVRDEQPPPGMKTYLFGGADRAGYQPVARDPGGIPGLQRGIANATLETVDLAARGHSLGAFVNGSAFARAMEVGHGGALYAV
jgi:hypothetical protein